MALQNQLGVELEKFMSVIRTSLRQFRQHLDETLQMLRESNARFIKSFKSEPLPSFFVSLLLFLPQVFNSVWQYLFLIHLFAGWFFFLGEGVGLSLIHI